MPINHQEEQKKAGYLKELNATSDRIRQHVMQSPNLTKEAAAKLDDFKFDRVPLPVMQNEPPMLEKNATTRSGSTLEMWEEHVDQRLNAVDAKLRNSDLSSMFASGKLEEMEF
ncbi:hypothetical protein KAFR_0I00470 [Kazachstania africana CBS 2517]|uniref:Uncharacterized protein n=1 Tax=Kazachstania africana (strain ATCC 22294 / BCRC 22015 / CBS 2517 / CECT 1963 / NBRC 1671 / NRRL Y-8276) TaxID=1071382 RepID=H2AZM8_KAZAF|nr:hypothetical protein KAFR_0I00470 [Kazachstania africana CBS 2517]CCF59828.1 hypothetical protein KAFR_0I00470 [Kazachstania africana CBS 2517]